MAFVGLRRNANAVKSSRNGGTGDTGMFNTCIGTTDLPPGHWSAPLLPADQDQRIASRSSSGLICLSLWISWRAASTLFQTLHIIAPRTPTVRCSCIPLRDMASWGGSSDFDRVRHDVVSSITQPTNPSGSYSHKTIRPELRRLSFRRFSSAPDLCASLCVWSCCS